MRKLIPSFSFPSNSTSMSQINLSSKMTPFLPTRPKDQLLLHLQSRCRCRMCSHRLSRSESSSKEEISSIRLPWRGCSKTGQSMSWQNMTGAQPACTRIVDSLTSLWTKMKKMHKSKGSIFHIVGILQSPILELLSTNLKKPQLKYKPMNHQMPLIILYSHSPFLSIHCTNLATWLLISLQKKPASSKTSGTYSLTWRRTNNYPLAKEKEASRPGPKPSLIIQGMLIPIFKPSLS